MFVHVSIEWNVRDYCPLFSKCKSTWLIALQWSEARGSKRATTFSKRFSERLMRNHFRRTICGTCAIRYGLASRIYCALIANSTPHNSCASPICQPPTMHVHLRRRKSIKFAFMCNNKSVVARIGYISPHIYISILAIRKWISKYSHHHTKPGIKSMFGAKCISVLCAFLISRHLVTSSHLWTLHCQSSAHFC